MKTTFDLQDCENWGKDTHLYVYFYVLFISIIILEYDNIAQTRCKTLEICLAHPERLVQDLAVSVLQRDSTETLQQIFGVAHKFENISEKTDVE